MASQITATLPTLDFPQEVDYPTQEDWAAFSAAAELNFGILGGSWSTQMQNWKDQANAMSIELNNNADIAQSIANYQGDWVSKGYSLGQSVSVSGVYYICKLTHSTGQNPTDVSSLYWNLALGNWSLKVALTDFIGENQVLGGVTGYQKLPGGLIIQWGTIVSISNGGGGQVLSYPITFPNRAFQPIICNGDNNPALFNLSVIVAQASRSGFGWAIDIANTEHRINWIAIGY